MDQKDLDSGRVDLARIALLNDYLDMDADNQGRIEKWRGDNER
ncbi:NTP pyrophosphohydrolase [Klebsiella electrica]